MYHTLASKGCSKIERKASELQTDGRIVSTRAKREKKEEAQHTLLAKSFSADGEQTLVRPIEDRFNHQSHLNYAAVRNPPRGKLLCVFIYLYQINLHLIISGMHV